MQAICPTHGRIEGRPVYNGARQKGQAKTLVAVYCRCNLEAKPVKDEIAVLHGMPEEQEPVEEPADQEEE